MLTEPFRLDVSSATFSKLDFRFVVSSALMTWKESQRDGGNLRGVKRSGTPGTCVMKPSNEGFTLSCTAALNEAQILAPWLYPLNLWVQNSKSERAIILLPSLKESSAFRLFSDRASSAREVFLRLFPVVPFGHRPANCHQASGFHS